jgi:hypothetical protein
MLESRNKTAVRNLHTSHNASKNAVDVLYFLHVVSDQAGHQLTSLDQHLTHFHNVPRVIREMTIQKPLGVPPYKDICKSIAVGPNATTRLVPGALRNISEM